MQVNDEERIQLLKQFAGEISYLIERRFVYLISVVILSKEIPFIATAKNTA